MNNYKYKKETDFDEFHNFYIDEQKVLNYRLMLSDKEFVDFKTAEDLVNYINDNGHEGGVVLESVAMLVLKVKNNKESLIIGKATEDASSSKKEIIYA